MYQATQTYLPSDALDIGVNPGDLVGVIQTKDPMGNSKRWFVDNGESQGFLPAHILNPIGDEADLKCIPNDNTANTSTTSTSNTTTTTHAYDDVAKDEPESTGKKHAKICKRIVGFLVLKVGIFIPKNPEIFFLNCLP